VLDVILAGGEPYPDAPEAAFAVAAVLGCLASPAGPGDLAGEEAARQAFTRTAARSARIRELPSGTGPGPRPFLSSVGRAAAALTAVAALSTTVAAQAGVLPRPAQNLAHHVIGAPPARLRALPPLPAVVRAGAESVLCAAYQRARRQDQGAALTTVLRRMVIQAAGGARTAGAYCAAGRLPAAPARPAPPPALQAPPAPPAPHGSSTASPGGVQPAGPRHGKGKGHSHGTGTGRGHGTGQGQQPGSDRNQPRQGPVSGNGNGAGNERASGSTGPDYGNANGQSNGNGQGSGHGHGNGNGRGNGNG